MASRLMKVSKKGTDIWTLEEKIGQLFFPAAFINADDVHIKTIEDLITTYNIGGLTFFHSPEMAATNYEKRKNISKNERSHERLEELIQHYQSISSHPLLISIDAEWGLAMRVENTEQYPYSLTLGSISDPYQVFEVGEAIGKDLRKTGIHLNLAPVVDVNDNPANPVIGYRSFGQDKKKVAEMACAFYRGMKSVGILGCAKHFPGHGNTSVDSHLSLPVISKTLKELQAQELYPFEKIIETGVDVVMPGHLAVPSLTGSSHEPASLSKTIVTELLKKQMGFEGAVITDALNMHAVSKMFELPGQLEVAALEAGNDMLSFSKNIPAAIELIGKEISAERIDSSFSQIEKLKVKARLIENTDEAEVLEPLSKKEASQLRERIAIRAITETKKGEPLTQSGLDKVACLIMNKKNDLSVFAQNVSRLRTMPIYEMISYSEQRANEMTASLSQYDTIAVGLYVPNIKPQEHFGLDQISLKWLADLAKNKKIHLVVFGNPYAMEFIDTTYTKRSLLAYQDLAEFEKKAAEILFGLLPTTGSLPVTLSKHGKL